MSGMYRCPECGRELRYQGLCWQCKAEWERQEVMAWTPEQIQEEQKKIWQELSLKEHMELYEEQGISHKEAMRLVAKDRGVSRRDVYQELLEGQ